MLLFKISSFLSVAFVYFLQRTQPYVLLVDNTVRNTTRKGVGSMVVLFQFRQTLLGHPEVCLGRTDCK